KHDYAVGEVLHVADQPGAGLGERLEHEHARHDRKSWKVVAQVLLSQRKILDGNQGLAPLDFQNPIDQHESHGVSREFKGKDEQRRSRGFWVGRTSSPRRVRWITR